MSGEQIQHVIVDSGTVTPATTDVLIGAVNETAPATDTASSGLNGRLQRIAQRLTSAIAAITAARLGAANLASSQAAPGVASTTIAVARATRIRCTIINTGSVTVFVGPTTATTSMGALAPGAFVTVTAPALIAGITSSGTAAVSVFDEYD